MSDEDQNLGMMVTCAKARHVARIVYQKPGEASTTTRNVEPYQLTHHGGNIIILTWQIAPEIIDGDCWRNFRADRLAMVQSTERQFSPRIAVTIDDGEVTPFVFGADPVVAPPKRKPKPAPTPAEKYFKYVEKAMLDGEMTKREINHAKKLSAELRAGQVRSEHARTYANLIAEVTMDGEISDDEEELLTNMRIFLNELGWAP